MNDKEMIEELAKLVRHKFCYHEDCDNCNFYGIGDHCMEYRWSKRAFENGYRKIPENAVVLTREEYEKFKSIENTIKRFSTISPTEAESENKALKEEIAIILAQKRNIWNSYNQLKQEMEWQIDKQTEEELDRVDKEARKKAVKEFATTLISVIWEEEKDETIRIKDLHGVIRDIANAQYRVNLGE